MIDSFHRKEDAMVEPEKQKSVTVRIKENLHRECKSKLAKEGYGFVDLIRKAIQDYVDGKFKM